MRNRNYHTKRGVTLDDVADLERRLGLADFDLPEKNPPPPEEETEEDRQRNEKRDRLIREREEKIMSGLRAKDRQTIKEVLRSMENSLRLAEDYDEMGLRHYANVARHWAEIDRQRLIDAGLLTDEGRRAEPTREPDRKETSVKLSSEQTGGLVRRVNDGPREGELYSIQRTAKSRWVGNVLMNTFDISETSAAATIQRWSEDGLLREVSYTKPNRHSGKGARFSSHVERLTLVLTGDDIHTVSVKIGETLL